MPDRRKVAAVITEYFPGSHADVIVTKFLKGFPTEEGLIEPRVDVASMYIDQLSDRDVGRGIAEEHGVPVFHSIRSALTVGGESLAVDGVLLIGEHGDYSWNEKEQQLFPRKYFMEQICGVMARSGRAGDRRGGRYLDGPRRIVYRPSEFPKRLARSSVPSAFIVDVAADAGFQIRCNSVT